MLIFAYKKLMPQLGGFLTDAGRVNLPRTEVREGQKAGGARGKWVFVRAW
jgi:5'-3' exonuclease